VRPDDVRAATPDGPIERYLDELTRLLAPGRPRDLRYLLAETEAHLHDEAEAGVAGGVSVSDAERQAVARLGPAADLARAELQRQRPTLRRIAYNAAGSAFVLAAIGSIAVGISGAIAAIIRAAAGAAAVADPSSSALSAAACARWLGNDPGASSCRAAATADWAAETIFYRIALGLVGAAALTGYTLWRRRARINGATGLPRIMVDTIGATAFAVAAGWTLALGIDALAVSSGHGWGQWLSATPVAAAGAVVFLVRALDDLRGPEPGLSPRG
jgi:hypothetical protein